MLQKKRLLLALSLLTLVGCGGGGGNTSSSISTNVNNGNNINGILQPITPLTASESFEIPAMNSLPSFTILDENGFDGDIDNDLSLIEGSSSITAVDIQRDFGVSTRCEDGNDMPAYLNEADLSEQTIKETTYLNGQVALSCTSKYESVLPVVLTNFNISDVLEDWGSENLVSTNCPSSTNGGPQIAPSTSLCTSISVNNYLITDNTGKEHKISFRVTSTPNN